MKINPEKIMESMIKKGFPDLYKESITLKYYRKRKDCFFEYSAYLDKTYSIDISESMKNCSIAVFKEGLAMNYLILQEKGLKPRPKTGCTKNIKNTGSLRKETLTLRQ